MTASLGVKGLPGRLVQGAVTAVAITGGKMGANVAAKLLPEFLTEPGTAADGTPVKVETKAGEMLRRLAGSAIVAFAADFIPGLPRWVKDAMIAGTFTTLVENVVKPALPTDPKNPLTGALSAGGRVVRMQSYPSMRAYPSANGRRAIAARTGLRAYPRERTLGQDYTSGQGGYVAVPGGF